MWFGEYVCHLTEIEVTNPETNVTFGGVHLENRTEADVEVVWMSYSNTPFMLPQLFTTFPNINELDIEFCNLQSINIPASARIQYLILYQNNITRLESGSLHNQGDM